MQPHRLVGQGLHHSQLHHPVRQQPQFPVVMALGGWAAGQGDEMDSARSSSFRYRRAWTRSLNPLQPIFGKAPLQSEHCALRHIQSLGHSGRRPSLIGLQQDSARVVTLAELFPARIICSNWPRSSGVSRTANFSLTTPPPHTNFNCSKITTASQPLLAPLITKLDPVLN